MKVYKDGRMEIFSPCIISKNILEKEFTRGITHFPVLVKKIINVLWHTKNNLVQNQEHKQHAIVNIFFSRKLYLYIETYSKHENNDT